MRQGNESCAFLMSNKKITLHGCSRVVKYTDKQIELAMCDMNTVVFGTKLSLATFVSGEIAVTGAIERIELVKKGGV